VRTISIISFPGIVEAAHFVILSRSMLFSFVRKGKEVESTYLKTLKKDSFSKAPDRFLGMVSIYTIWHDGCFYIRG